MADFYLEMHVEDGLAARDDIPLNAVMPFALDIGKSRGNTLSIYSNLFGSI